MFITALFTIVRTWKEPRCPSADEWIRKLWYIYTMEYYSAIKKNTFESVLMRWMKLEPIIQSELSQKEKCSKIRSNCQHLLDIEKARAFQKNIYFCFIDYAKAFDCVDHNKLENSERYGNTRPPDLPLDKPICRSRSKLELDMEQQTGSK